jgi:hypothetical protein
MQKGKESTDSHKAPSKKKPHGLLIWRGIERSGSVSLQRNVMFFGQNKSREKMNTENLRHQNNEAVD